MHGYYWSPKRLQDLLFGFENGQFQMTTKEGEVFRGEIDRCEVSPGKRRVQVFLSWWRQKPRWVLVPEQLGKPHMIDVWYRTYYYQPDEERIKMWGFGEVLRFFKPDDYTNLVPKGDTVVPRYTTLNQRGLRCCIIMLLGRSEQQPS